MKRKGLVVPMDCEGALATAIRVRIIYLQSYREQIHTRWLAMKAEAPETHSLQRAEESITMDIAALIMLQDNLAEAVPS